MCASFDVDRLRYICECDGDGGVLFGLSARNSERDRGGKITDRLKEIRHRDQIGIPKKIFETSNFIQQEPDISYTFY